MADVQQRKIYQVKGGCVAVRFAVLGMIANNTYFIDDGRGGTVVVDPSAHADAVVRQLGVRVSAILVTHNHWDHLTSLAEVQKATGARVYASMIDSPLIERGQEEYHQKAPGCKVDVKLNDGDEFTTGDITWKCLLTPGHTPGGMCFFADSGTRAGAPVLASGDTLFQASIGRTDFEGGSMPQMRASLRKLAELPDATIVLPGHNSITTIGAERHRVLEALM